MRVYYHPTVGDYAKYDSFELDHAALAGVPSGIAAGLAGWAFKRASWETLLASLGGGGLMAGAFGAFYPKKVLSWFNPPPFDAPIVYPRQVPKVVVPSFIGESGQVLNLLMHEGAGDVVKDYSPCGNHGRIYNANWVDGPWGWALNFNGVNAYVRAPNAASLNPTTAIAIMAWAKPSGGYSDLNYPSIVRKANTYALRFSSANGSLAGFVWIGGVTRSSAALADAWDPTRFHHFAFVYNGTRLRLYRDGEQAVGAIAQTGNIDVTTTDLGVGAQGDGSYRFRGIIALPRIYSLLPADLDAWVRSHFEAERVLFGV